MQEKILRTLTRFDSIEYKSLKEEVLRGAFSFAAEKDFDIALSKLREQGQIENASWFGRWWAPRGKTNERRAGTRTPEIVRQRSRREEKTK
jgi:hypothetical protein